MRILRIRRGFTTNSSSASEFVTTPESTHRPAATAAEQQQQVDLMQQYFQRHTPRPVEQPAPPPNGTPKPAAAEATVTVQSAPAQPVAGGEFSGAVRLSLLGAVVVVVFAIERIVRRILRRRRKARFGAGG